MLKNNFKSILIHVFIGFICLAIFEIQGEIIGYRVNVLGYSENSYGGLHFVTALVVFILALFLYFILSKQFLEKLSIKKSLLSVMSVAIIGTILWLLSYNIFSQNMDIGDDFLKLYYQIYTAYCLPLFSIFYIKSSYLAGIFVIIPSLLMWIGIQFKSNEQ